ncbi:T9SS type A sorting domain-containing protein [Formosa sediminum]|uniref:T9SS type A sorting domain-containing protein n=1 Tax=Formosa sediminum TaxID=2594004 RepID=A0A516GP23_9FLAO|nr:T9SS type A sorting domain-containing protein [Formosa sediminum]QDO93110.1 T9SS type A sorting domain-containing protein [Formosa sediminum]
MSFYGQTVTKVFPTRVTYQTKITVIGTGFTSSTTFSITNSNISISNTVFVSETEMTFKISKNSATTTSTGDVTGNLNLGGSDTGIDIYYIAPRTRTLQNSGGTNAVTKITEIYSKLDVLNSTPVFWRSSSSVTLDNSNDLLGFKYNGIVYSTGVDNDMLETNLSGEIDITDETQYIEQTFKAYSTNGVEGDASSDNYIGTADYVDGEYNEGSTITSNFIKGLTAYDVITDGVNGLDLGTGIANFNQTSSIKFFSGNGQVGAVTDSTPDLLITQIAQPGGTSGYDVYYYADEEGNVIGRPIKLVIMDESDGAAKLTTWNVDFYSMKQESFATSTPVQKQLGNNATRPLRMVGLELSDFDITNVPSDTNSYIGNVNNINLMAGGKCDLSFLAYNKSAFEIKAPNADVLLPRYVCRVPSTTDITFSVIASVDGGYTGGTANSNEALSYQWSKYNEALSNTTASLTINDVKESDLATYNVKVYNDYGSIIVPVTLSQGGTPTSWDGTSWSVSSLYAAAGITINDQDKSLIFYNDYNEDTDLVGCDCTVKAGNDVVIPSGKTLTLYNEIIVEPYEASYVLEDGNIAPAVAAGTFTLENNASLVQINDEDGNINSGDINVERLADNLHAYDYVYWSSPVEGVDVSEIDNSRAYKWDPTSPNATGSTGDWIRIYNEIMNSGVGYIARVPSSITGISGANSYTSTFTGVPNNATINVSVKKSGTPLPDDEADRHQNFVGNPYPSAINAIDFLTKNSNIEGNVSLWMHNAEISEGLGTGFYEESVNNYGDQFVYYNATGTSIPNAFDGYIASGQGFFVQLLESESNGSVAFTNDMRYDAAEIEYDNSEFFRQDSSDESNDLSVEKQLIWLNLVNEENLSTSTLIGYVDGATYEKDRLYDVSVSDEDFKIYSLISDSKMVIQGRPLPFLNVDEVPLGIDVLDNGMYKIGISNFEGTNFIDDVQDVYLRDTYLDVEHDLRTAPYSFTAVSGETKDRFILVYNASNVSTLATDEALIDDTFAYIKNGTLYVKSAKTINTVQIFDLTGKQVISYNSVNYTKEFSAPFSFSRGGYIVSISLEGGSVITKKLIN